MKRVVVLIFSVVVLLAACKPQDEKRTTIKAEIGAFDRDWAATNDIVNNWGLELKQKIAADSSIAINCPQLEQEYNTALTEWNTAGKAFNDWKVKFENDEVKTDDAAQNLKEFKEILEKYNVKAVEWQALLENCLAKTKRHNDSL